MRKSVPSAISPVRTIVFDSSMRSPLVYAIAVRYQTPLWPAGGC